MRAAVWTVNQALTPEAAAVVKQAINLARRRGHAQVTPLHVANTILSSSTGLLRAACLQSHSHPLQCKAMELCFNVALNRLPATTLSTPILGPPHVLHHTPSLSNALVAAFKRAQAHQRRGSIESQQQPLLAVKIELEQLIISILDDPSVSRVMREAGFSSTQVKINVEQAVSTKICEAAPPNRSPSKPKEVSNPFTTPPASKTKSLVQVKNEDVLSVVDSLVRRKKRSIVIVGECLATTEAVVGGVMDKVDKGEVPDVLGNVQFIPLPLFSFRHMPLEAVDQKVGELRCLVKSCCVDRGAVLYLKDLNWAAEYRASRGEKGRNNCPLEHVIMEIRNLFCGGFEGEISNGRLWLMGNATYQTYMRCRVGNPSLETLWSLQPLIIPTGSLGLSLNSDSDLSQMTIQISGGVQFLPPAEHEIGSHLSCCADWSINLETEARSLHNTSYGSHGSISSSLPSWLRQYREGNRRVIGDDQGCLQLKDMSRKWNCIGSSAHKSHNHPYEIAFNLSSVSPSSSSISSYDRHFSSLHQIQQPWLLPLEVKQHSWSEHHLWTSEATDEDTEHKSRNNAQEHAGQKSLCVNPQTDPNSASSCGTIEMEYLSKFKELNAENLRIICNALERRVTYKQDIIAEIASTILQCRSGLIRRKDKFKSLEEKKEETWLFFQGNDTEGKERIAKEIASIVFGSYTNFITIGLSNIPSTHSDDFTDIDVRNKRSRAEASHSYLESLFEAIRENPHRVVMMGDIEQVDYYTRVGIKKSIERGKIQNYSGEEVSVCDAIIILSCESLDSRSRACSPPVKQKATSEDEKEEAYEKEVGTCLSLDLNLCAEDEDLDDRFFDNMGLLECVDRTFFF